MANHQQPTHVVCLGHSFIRRLQVFCANSTGQSINLGLDPDKRVVSFVHSSGMHVHQLTQYTAQVLLNTPSLVIIDIGTNDLQATSALPHVLASQVFQFAKSLVAAGVRSVVIMEVFFRTAKGKYATPSVSTFLSAAHKYNNVIKSMVTGQAELHHDVHFWHHKGLCLHWEKYIQDGVHLTPQGTQKYFKSVRNCVIYHSNKMLH